MEHNHKHNHILIELQHHIPYTIFSVMAGMIILGIITVLTKQSEFSFHTQKLFHIFHPLHLFFSAIATTSMFWRHDKKLIKAVVIGFIGSVGICGISDIFLPFISGGLLGVKMHLHICIITHVKLILPFVIFGIFGGFVIPSVLEPTIFSHSLHVFISSMASILYLVSYGLVDWIQVGGMVFIYIVLSVIIPCCMSDIIFPLLFTKRN